MRTLFFVLILACGPGPLNDRLGRDHVVTRLTALAVRNNSAYFAYPYADSDPARIHVTCPACQPGVPSLDKEVTPLHGVLAVSLPRGFFDGREVLISATRHDSETAYLSAKLRGGLVADLPTANDIAFLSNEVAIFSLPTIAPIPAGYYAVDVMANHATNLFTTDGCRITAANQVETTGVACRLFVIDIEDDPVLAGIFDLPNSL